jgi:hypothetical protein
MLHIASQPTSLPKNVNESAVIRASLNHFIFDRPVSGRMWTKIPSDDSFGQTKVATQ